MTHHPIPTGTTGIKNVKLNLPNAYRTTYTHLVAGDEVRVQVSLFRASLDPSPGIAPKRSFWATVTKVDRQPGWISVEVESPWYTGPLSWTVAHTAVTRKERDIERQARMETEVAETEVQPETVPLEAPEVTAAAVLAVADGDFRAARSAVGACMVEEAARPNSRQDYLNHYQAQLDALDSLELDHLEAAAERAATETARRMCEALNAAIVSYGDAMTFAAVAGEREVDGKTGREWAREAAALHAEIIRLALGALAEAAVKA